MGFRIRNIMMDWSPYITLLVSFATLSAAIRVDWNTNKGPIIPPTSTVPPVPKQPYRDPAPVWEDQSGDVANPNAYQYVLPAPSRPRPATDNYLRSPLKPTTNYEQKQPVYGQLITKYPDEIPSSRSVPTLAVHYIPNVGYKYNAVIPAPQKLYYVKNDDHYQEKHSKWNGKYNAKSKKYKAYEKVKYTPQAYHYFPVPYQQLPYERPAQQFTTQQATTYQQPFASEQPTTVQQGQQQQQQQQYYQQQTQYTTATDKKTATKHQQQSQKTSHYSPNSFTGSIKSRR